MSTYRVISGDSHLDIPPERWVPHVPAKWRERAPRTVRLQNGNDGLLLENRPPHTPGAQLTGTGRRYDLHDVGPITYDGPGTGTPEQRCREQTQDGIDAEIMYTHPSYIRFWRGIRDDEPYKAMFFAYNEWLGTEYCAYAPDRLIAMGVIPDTGVDDAIAEMEHCARVGLKGVALYHFPSGKNYPTPADDRFWAAALAMGMPITAHTAGGTTRFERSEPIYPSSPDVPAGRDPISILCRFCGDTAVVPIQLALAGVFDRFPTLRIYHAETQAGWVPFALFQIDDNYARERFKMERNLGIPPLPRPPSDYITKHALWGFMRDPVAVQRRHEIGVEKLIWGNDFAHAQGDWPESREVIDEMMVGVPPDERERMLAGNVVDFFHLDGAPR
ncbi:MAG TPA: amidohydrolase family protein [Chloroflexota bacterium]|nr:amidohydrolase family protein [Chloroflexota bacterium]